MFRLTSIKFSAKIDDRGRIYLPSKLRKQIDYSVSFSANVVERKIFIQKEGNYRIDSKGRLVLPADIRRSLGINSGDVVELDLSMKKNRVMKNAIR